MATTVYFGMLELLAQYDDVLKQHLQKLTKLGRHPTIFYKMCSRQSVKSLCNSWGNVFWMRSFLASNVPGTIELRLFPRHTRGMWIN